ncbi:MAG: L,D-transpeptidase family protein [Pseudomonadota bacterium]
MTIREPGWQWLSVVRTMLCVLGCTGFLAATVASADPDSTTPPRRYAIPAADQALVGEPEQRITVYEDTLAAIARRAGVGFAALQRANPTLDPWLPGADAAVLLPTATLLPPGARDGILINLAERRLYYFDGKTNQVFIYPVGIGRREFPTPLVQTRTVLRIHQPSWTPTESIRREHAARGDILPHTMPPGPDNPMGEYAIKLAAPGLFIHGTNQPLGVGGRVSHGCLRLYPEHIRKLANAVPNGTPVRIMNEPYKVAWHGDGLYLEVHPDESKGATLSRMVGRVIAATGTVSAQVDWPLATATARAAAGIPVRIGQRAKSG